MMLAEGRLSEQGLGGYAELKAGIAPVFCLWGCAKGIGSLLRITAPDAKWIADILSA